MNGKVWPVFELLVDLRERVIIVFGQLDLLPQICRAVCALDGLDVQKALAIVLVDGSVLRIRQRARLTVTEACYVVLIATEVLVLVGELCFEGAELLVYHLPYHLIALHVSPRPAAVAPLLWTKRRCGVTTWRWSWVNGVPSALPRNACPVAPSLVARDKERCLSAPFVYQQNKMLLSSEASFDDVDEENSFF